MRQHLTDFYRNTNGWLEITLMRPKDLGGIGPSLFVTWWEMPRQIQSAARYFQKREVQEVIESGNYGVHYAVALQREKRPGSFKRSTDHGVLMTPGVFIEIDRDDGKTLADVEQFNLLASTVIESGGGWHVYWLFEEPFVFETEDDIDLYRRVLGGLAGLLGGDANATNPSRMLRLPGFVNTKPKRNGVQVSVYHRGASRYTMADFEPYAVPKKSVYVPVAPDGYTPSRDSLPAPAQRYLEAGAVKGERNRHLHWVARVMAENQYSQTDAEQLLIPRAVADGLPENEARAAIASAYRSTTTRAVPPHLANRFSVAYGVKA